MIFTVAIIKHKFLNPLEMKAKEPFEKLAVTI